MVTGIEAAGLALAVFPLILKGLKVYLDGAQMIQDLAGWRSVLKRLVRELDVECICFEDVCSKLLERIASSRDATEPMNGNAWDDPDLQRKLRERLGSEATARFTELMKELHQLLKELRDELGIHDESVEPNRQTWGRMKVVLRKEDALNDISRTLRLLERLAQCRTNSVTKPPRQNTKIYSRFRKNAIDLYDTLLKTFRAQQTCRCSAPHNANLRLERIPNQKSTTPSPRFSVLLSFDVCSDMQSELLLAWREFEFRPLGDRNGLETACKDTEIRPITPVRRTATPTPAPAIVKPVERRRDIIFEGLKIYLRSIFRGRSSPRTPIRDKKIRKAVSFDRDVSAVPRGTSSLPTVKTQGEQAKKAVSFAIETLPKATIQAPPNAREITDLCALIASAEGNSPDLGVLASDKSWIIRTSPTSCEGYTAEFVSLDQLLQREDLDRGDRLRLGVELAFSLMHLHTTDWLDESWGACDILFPQKATRARGVSGEEIMILGAVLRKPVVRRSFHPDRHYRQKSKATAEVSILTSNQSLFSLGVVLIELWFGKRLQNLFKPPDAVSDNKYVNDLVSTFQLVAVVEEEAGEIYGGAVRRCIRGLDSAVKSLDNDEFKSKVDTEVVSELERNWNAYAVSLEE